ncbi:hypothetical protein [Argonema galeatum]|uniref:hypothetical protein n=1 Tax=Argonema galeatum TaxID=2942762 RepID=UPI0020111CE6|nr:hypothetical protein [Argonema galeatum]MCL1464636.1 hypothetical protein [Argonema galeatum A003/A1]
MGTTGVSAALLNRSTRQLYPIAWVYAGQRDSTEPIFRLPVMVSEGTLLRNFKPYLKVGLTYYCAETDKWEPVLQLSGATTATLKEVSQTLEGLLATLNPKELQISELGGQIEQSQISNLKLEKDTSATNLKEEKPHPPQPPSPLEERGEYFSPPRGRGGVGGGVQLLVDDTSFLSVNSQYAIAAVGLEPETLRFALSQLAGAIVSCPAHWPEAYRFNVRESILAASLVASPDRICFVEEAIASLLAELSSDLSVENKKEPIAEDFQQTYPKFDRRGATLILHTGATTTELALVDLPTDIQSLTYADFTLRSFPYAGSYLDQDIICQLLLNPEFGSSLSTQDKLLSTDLDLPLPGEPDLPTRYLLQQRLESSTFGQTLLESAQYVKLRLPHQDSFTLEIGAYRWVLRRQDLENRVFAPFIQRLNRELNTQLALLGIPVEAIGQAICTGGTALLPSVTNWLRQKLPNAKTIHESGVVGVTHQFSVQESESKILWCFGGHRDGNRQDAHFAPNRKSQIPRVAVGLATLPLYPQVFDESRQQYSDYFLLMELLRVFGEEPLSVGRIMYFLERKGINTLACQGRILALLEGDLPPSLVPSELDANLLSQDSWQNPDYQALRGKKLFDKEDNQTYRLNRSNCDRLRDYLRTVLEQTHQKLEEPYAVYWIASAGKENT